MLLNMLSLISLYATGQYFVASLLVPPSGQYYDLPCRSVYEFWWSGMLLGFAVGYVFAAIRYSNNDPKENGEESDDENEEPAEDEESENEDEEPEEEEYTFPPLKEVIPEVCPSNEKPQEKLSPVGRELFDLLDAALSSRNKEALGPPPVRFPVSAGGGYVTNDQLERDSIAYAIYEKTKNLSFSEEREILKKCSTIVDKSYHEAMGILSLDKYVLHPIYVVNANSGDHTKKMSSLKFSPRTIGVILEDPYFDKDTYVRTNNWSPSHYSSVVNLVDVGGLDSFDEGRNFIIQNYLK